MQFIRDSAQMLHTQLSCVSTMTHSATLLDTKHYRNKKHARLTYHTCSNSHALHNWHFPLNLQQTCGVVWQHSMCNNNMSEPGFEPGSTRPQRVVLSTRRFGPTIAAPTTINTTPNFSRITCYIQTHHNSDCTLLDNVHLTLNIRRR